MPRSIHKEWRERLAQIFEEHPRWGPVPIEAELLRLYPDRDSWPQDEQPPAGRTISDHKKAHFQQPESERALYRYLRWPETFEAGVLPWEAAAPLMQVLRARLVAGRRHVTVRWGRWYWRLYLAAPDAPPNTLSALARVISAHEVLGLDMDRVWRAAEGMLAYRYWESATRQTEYKAALDNSRVSSVPTAITVPPDATFGTQREAVIEWYGLTEKEAEVWIEPIRGVKPPPARFGFGRIAEQQLDPRLAGLDADQGERSGGD